MSIKRSRLQSVIWDYFEEDSSQQDLARCIACDTKLRRGAPGSKRSSWSTKSLWDHLEAAHKENFHLAAAHRDKTQKEKEKKRKLEDEQKQLYDLSDMFAKSRTIRSTVGSAAG